jgi:cyclase
MPSDIPLDRVTNHAPSNARRNLPRVIPCLLLEEGRLVKTQRFKDAKYIGDPLNAVRIFNEKEVDELVFLDISASKKQHPPNFQLIREISAECFMPFAYGGGIRALGEIREILLGGAEKVVLDSILFEKPDLISQAAAEFGSQSIVAAIDVKRDLFGRYRVYNAGRGKLTSKDPVDHAVEMVKRGAGEVLLNDVDRDGMRSGFDLALIGKISEAVDVPVVPCGGAAELADLGLAIRSGASAIAAGSLFVLHGKHRAVLITYPSRDVLARLF